MLLVLTSVYDANVAAGLAHWRSAGLDVRPLTCRDLAQPGWRWTLDEAPKLVVGGEPIAAEQVRGVLCRLAWVSVHELDFVAAADRAYAAAEMQAFLLALLTRLECPVINRPAPGSLAGPAWSPERWLACAAAAGVAVRPIVRRAWAGGLPIGEPPPPARRTVEVVGDRVFGDAAEPLRVAAQAIARQAGCDLLRVGFVAGGREPEFIDADPWVDLSDPDVAAAVAGRFSP